MKKGQIFEGKIERVEFPNKGIAVISGEEKNIINLEQCAELLQVLKTRIKNVEIYYNPYTTKLEGEIEGAKIFNIITQEEV